MTLDKIGPKLCTAGAGYHAHTSAAGGTVGSIWTGGVGGLGVEFHMDFDFSFFNKNWTSMLNYCSATSVGICSEDSCDMSETF